MSRMLILCAMLALPPAARPDDPPKPAETIVSLSVSAQAAPKPALKYQLLPEVNDLSPGNPILDYLKCFMEQNNFFFSKEQVENRDKWQMMPLHELPLDKVRNYGGQALRGADAAARLEPADWQILLKVKAEGFRLLLPEIQQLRTLAQALKVRFRAEVAERRFDNAIVTAKTLLGLARHLGEHPTLIGNLVGLYAAHLALGPLDEMIGQPGCPNLYWALSDLPVPLVGIRRGLQGERTLGNGELPLEQTSSMSEAQLKRVIDNVVELISLSGPGQGPQPEVRGYLEGRTSDDAIVRAARSRLVQLGLLEAHVKRFPAVQVILLDEKFSYQVQRDEGMKWMEMPYWQSEAALLAWSKNKPENGPLQAALLPSMLKVRRAQARLEQRIALLRCVEALRLHAAANGGKFPDRLADVKEPLPSDPVTGKPFAYSLNAQKATLKGATPKGEEKNALFTVRYELTIRK